MMRSEPKDKALAWSARRLPSRPTPPDGVLDGRDGRVVASREKGVRQALTKWLVWYSGRENECSHPATIF